MVLASGLNSTTPFFRYSVSLGIVRLHSNSHTRSLHWTAESCFSITFCRVSGGSYGILCTPRIAFWELVRSDGDPNWLFEMGCSYLCDLEPSLVMWSCTHCLERFPEIDAGHRIYESGTFCSMLPSLGGTCALWGGVSRYSFLHWERFVCSRGCNITRWCIWRDRCRFVLGVQSTSMSSLRFGRDYSYSLRRAGYLSTLSSSAGELCQVHVLQIVNSSGWCSQMGVHFPPSGYSFIFLFPLDDYLFFKCFYARLWNIIKSVFGWRKKAHPSISPEWWKRWETEGRNECDGCTWERTLGDWGCWCLEPHESNVGEFGKFTIWWI